MKKIIISTFLALSLFTATTTSYGHGDHAPPAPVSESEVLLRSIEDVAVIVDGGELIEEQPLDASWKNIKKPAVKQKGDGYYIVTFKHPEQGKTLYILMSDAGTYYDANFTGKFSGIAH